jgi:hypothetical protein
MKAMVRMANHPNKHDDVIVKNWWQRIGGKEKSGLTRMQ